MGLIILFFFDVIIFGALVVWVLLLMIMAIPVVSKNPYLKARAIMTFIPASIILSSLIISLFFGVFGPVQRTAPAFVYFFTLYLLYTIFLMIGYWPTESAFKGSLGNPNTASESTKIFGTDTTYTEFNQDAHYIPDDDL